MATVNHRYMAACKPSEGCQIGNKYGFPARNNPEWNCSSPHGAGRLISRTVARDTLTVEEFQCQMAGICTTCVVQGTLDESPMAYKGMDAILSQIGPTTEVVRQIKPIYNYKAGT